ncbi:MAG TPA: immunoglobulin-like domain-containing protein [Candidatus Limnocylindrales bacterium]|nr:immunoglobulin-like domain-containing protein [Candidatus Limnocylindrales bacterium]
MRKNAEYFNSESKNACIDDRTKQKRYFGSIVISFIWLLFFVGQSFAAPVTPNNNWKLVFDAGIDAPFNYSTSFTPKVWLYNQGGNPVTGAAITYTYFDVNGNTQVANGTATGSGGLYSGAALNMQNYAGKYINVLFSVSAGSNTLREQHVFFAGQSNAAHGALWKIQVLNTSQGPSWKGNTAQKVYIKLYSDSGIPYRNNFYPVTYTVKDSAGVIVQATANMNYEEDGIYSFTTTTGYTSANEYFFEIANQWSGQPTGAAKNQPRYTTTYAGLYLEANNTQGDEAPPEIISVERKPYFPVDDDLVNITVHAVDNLNVATRTLYFTVNNQTVQNKSMSALTGIEYRATLDPYLLEDNVRYQVVVSDGTYSASSDWYFYNVQDHRGTANMSHSFLSHPVYWFGKSRQASFDDNGGDTNFDGAYNGAGDVADNAAYLGNSLMYDFFKDMTRIKVQTMIMDETGKPIQHLTNVKAWLSNNTAQPAGTHNREKVMTEVSGESGVYTAIWEGSPDVIGNDALNWSQDARTIWANYSSGEVYSVYIDVNNDGQPEENITWLAYTFGDTFWGSAEAGKTWNSHNDLESPGSSCGRTSCHDMTADLTTRTGGGPTCPDCHGVYKSANGGVFPVNSGTPGQKDVILYGNSTSHPRRNNTNATYCGDETCHNVAWGSLAAPLPAVDIPGYPTGTRINGTFNAEYPNPLQCAEHHNYTAGKIPVEEGHNKMVACKYCHGGSHDNNKLKDYNRSIIGTNESNVNRGTPGYVGSGGINGSGTYAGDCYKDCHKVQVEHSLIGKQGNSSNNAIVPCDECHQNFNIAPMHQDNVFPYPNRSTCGGCHQNSDTINAYNKSNGITLNPPRISNPQTHAQQTGIRWNNTGTRPYWVENENSCRYCHGRSYNEAYGLGRVRTFMGNNIINGTINSTSYWCSSCHVNTSSQNYTNMVNIYNYSFGVVPPEITGSTWKSNREGYDNHSNAGVNRSNSSTYNDGVCFDCHSGSLSSTVSMDTWQHQVSASGGEDITAPEWSPVPSNQVVEYGTSFSYDVSATDDSAITYSINDTANFAIDSGTGLIINKTGTVLTLGNYGLNITATDASLNSNSSIISVTVQDTTAPVITRLGTSPVTVEVGSVYTDAGATASDNYDGNLTTSIVTVNPVNTAVKGTYTVTYNVNDSSNNAATEVTRTVNVVDTTAPVITRLGTSPVTVEVGSVYTDPGATASDNYDGNLTTSIVTVNPVNTAVKGTYTVTYNVNDSSNNAATQITRTVNVVDTTAPVITRLGTSPVTVEVGSVYTDAGATAADNYDGNLTTSIVTVNPVNTAIKGTYTVTYNVNDSSNNAATEVTRTVNVVDTTAPVITRLGTSPVTVEVGSVYTDAGATASDNYDGNLTTSIVTVNPVNTAVKATYTVTYNVNDSSNNAATEVTRTVNVMDTTAPVITRLGTSPVTVEVGSVYTDAGATASDNYDGNLTTSIVTVNPVNTAVKGTYTVTYNVNDSSNNAATQVTRTVNVVDTTAPVITRLGTSPVTVEVGSVYTDAGATASDNYDGNLTTSIVTINPVNTAVKGTYTVTYNVNDSSNNAATQVTRTVNVVDTTAPVITRLGTSPVTVEVGSVYTDAGATASDNYDGNLTSSIVTVNPVNTAVKGTYTVTYNVNDSSNNAATEVTRTVNVVDTTAPVITRLGTSPVTVEVGSVYTDAGATASDSYDGDLTGYIVTVNPVDNTTVGTYTVTYNVNDSSNNAATEVTRTVNVVDTTAPTWSTIPSDQTIQVGTAFSYDVNATDLSAINYSINDTANFAIDQGTGLITNATELAEGIYGLNITATDPSSNSVSQIITVTVQAESTYSVSGYVFDNNNAGIVDVSVQNGSYSATTSGTGSYSITGLIDGDYYFSYTKPGFDVGYLLVTVSGSDVVNANKTIYDNTPPDQVIGLMNDTPTTTSINLSWSLTQNASYYQIFRNSSLTGTTQNIFWNDTGLAAGTTYQYQVRANDSYNNWGLNSTTLDVTTASPGGDSTPPASVTGLVNVSYAMNYINWTWTDPQDEDFDKVKVYLNGEFKEDVQKGIQFYNATVTPGTYTIGTRTVDTNSNVNATMVTHTATTILPSVRYINGTVIDSVNKTGIPDVTVSTNTNLSTKTNATGSYSFTVTAGSFDLTAKLDPTYYTNSSVTVSTELNAVVVQDIELVKKPTGTIAGIVSNA